MRFLRGIRGFTRRDRFTNYHIREELNITKNINNKSSRYENNWVLHVERIKTNRITSKALNYRPERKRSLGRPCK